MAQNAGENEKSGGIKSAEEMPGTLAQGWETYAQWARYNHSAWSSAFNTAEENRQKEDDRWREYFEKVYDNDMSFYKKMTMFALNAIQLWALWKQFKQQKEIADKTYEVADRQQRIAEELFAFYKSEYLPQEEGFNKSLTGYTNNPYCPDYAGTGDRFEENTKNAFARAKITVIQCNSQHCLGLTKAMNKQWALEQAQFVVNARNTAYRYEELRKETYDAMWRDYQIRWISLGRNVTKEGQNGLMSAFATFSGMKADPGGALNQLLGTLSNTVGSAITSPIAPNGNAMPIDKPSAVPYDIFLHRVKQSGDLQRGKASKTTRQN